MNVSVQMSLAMVVSQVVLGLIHHTLSDSKGKHFVPCQPTCYKESFELFILSIKLNNSSYGFSM